MLLHFKGQASTTALDRHLLKLRDIESDQQSNQILLYHYQYAKIQLNSSIHP